MTSASRLTAMMMMVKNMVNERRASEILASSRSLTTCSSSRNLATSKTAKAMIMRPTPSSSCARNGLPAHTSTVMLQIAEPTIASASNSSANAATMYSAFEPILKTRNCHGTGCSSSLSRFSFMSVASVQYFVRSDGGAFVHALPRPFNARGQIRQHHVGAGLFEPWRHTGGVFLGVPETYGDPGLRELLL